ncbi:unnamed protein product [Orchesella dallaii]|uniref:Uncharacterized protein n=1 Tax=Orchesella dallaii TaxID=48710 RepID=A0ABP1S1J7_9HEXA
MCRVNGILYYHRNTSNGIFYEYSTHECTSLCFTLLPLQLMIPLAIMAIVSLHITHLPHHSSSSSSSSLNNDADLITSHQLSTLTHTTFITFTNTLYLPSCTF